MVASQRKTTEEGLDGSGETTTLHHRMTTPKPSPKSSATGFQGSGWINNCVEESTIHSIYASGYETKPALSVLIHVIELTNVPAELRVPEQFHKKTKAPLQTSEQVEKKQKELKCITVQGITLFSWVKMIYRAWYLKPKTWKRRASTECCP
ncbi:protein FAM47E-like [Lytechinus pictus]|uniref:protein FAM47E-like n=1 Tax=Lytechinus pictus TaxID=7653 RepID=UPI0030BA23D7